MLPHQHTRLRSSAGAAHGRVSAGPTSADTRSAAKDTATLSHSPLPQRFLRGNDRADGLPTSPLRTSLSAVWPGSKTLLTRWPSGALQKRVAGEVKEKTLPRAFGRW